MFYIMSYLTEGGKQNKKKRKKGKKDCARGKKFLHQTTKDILSSLRQCKKRHKKKICKAKKLLTCYLCFLLSFSFNSS